MPLDFVRRGQDMLGSIFLPAPTLLPLVPACLIELESPAPAICRHRRVGLHDRVFSLLTLRSMRGYVEAVGPRCIAARDPRLPDR